MLIEVSRDWEFFINNHSNKPDITMIKEIAQDIVATVFKNVLFQIYIPARRALYEYSNMSSLRIVVAENEKYIRSISSVEELKETIDSIDCLITHEMAYKANIVIDFIYWFNQHNYINRPKVDAIFLKTRSKEYVKTLYKSCIDKINDYKKHLLYRISTDKDRRNVLVFRYYSNINEEIIDFLDTIYRIYNDYRAEIEDTVRITLAISETREFLRTMGRKNIFIHLNAYLNYLQNLVAADSHIYEYFENIMANPFILNKKTDLLHNELVDKNIRYNSDRGVLLTNYLKEMNGLVEIARFDSEELLTLANQTNVIGSGGARILNRNIILIVIGISIILMAAIRVI